jgi:hypothetical protein
MARESEDTDPAFYENNAPVKTTETELKMVIRTETEVENTDLASGDVNGDGVGEDVDDSDIEGRGSRDRRGDGNGCKEGGVEGEEQGGERGGGGRGGGGTVVHFDQNPLPAHTGISNNINANAKPFLADIMKKKFQLSQKKGIEENQIISGNTEYSVNGDKAVSVINVEDFADRKVRDVLTVTRIITWHCMAYIGLAYMGMACVIHCRVHCWAFLNYPLHIVQFYALSCHCSLISYIVS